MHEGYGNHVLSGRNRTSVQKYDHSCHMFFCSFENSEDLQVDFASFVRGGNLCRCRIDSVDAGSIGFRGGCNAV